MSKNKFSPEKYYDFKIVNESNLVVGHIRLKPSGILWAPSNSKKWYGISIDKFSEYMVEHGKRQVK